MTLAALGSLPAGHRLTVERRAADGVWQAKVAGRDGRVIAWAEGEDCDTVAEEALVEALGIVSAESGYHPEREVE